MRSSDNMKKDKHTIEVDEWKKFNCSDFEIRILYNLNH
jgi:hypothetical protein